MIQRRIFALSAVACLFAGSAIWATEHGRAVASKYTIAARDADVAADRVKGEVDLRTAFESVAEAVRPSVVSIAMKRPAESGRMNRFRGGRMSPREERGVGSGVIVSADGYVLTNNHVVAEATEVLVNLCDGRELTATVVGTDPRTDLAVLKIEGGDVRPLQFADSGKLKVGQWVAAFGTPFGLDQTMSSGIVSALGRANMHITDYEDFIQTDAAINPGNSGGPLVDLHGRIIGINSAIVSSGGGSNGVGLAIPSNLVRSIYERLIRDGHVVRGWMGIAIQDVTAAFAAEFAFTDEYDAGERGVLVGDVTVDSPAARAGVKSGDIVTRIDRTAVNSMQHFRTLVADLAPGTGVELAIWRDGKRIELDATIGNVPGAVVTRAATPAHDGGLGLEISNVSPAARREFGLADDATGAVVTNVDPGSPAAEAGLQPGDVIVEVSRALVDCSEAAARALERRPGEKIVLRIQRESASHWVELKAPARR